MHKVANYTHDFTPCFFTQKIPWDTFYTSAPVCKECYISYAINT